MVMEAVLSRDSGFPAAQRKTVESGPLAGDVDHRSSLQYCNGTITTASTQATDMSKVCSKCGAPYTGFGETCSTCRKAGKEPHTVQCEACRGWFIGFSALCEECVEKTQEAFDDPESAVKLLQRSQGKAPAAKILERMAAQEPEQRKSIVDAGGVAPLVRLLVADNADSEAKGSAAKTLKNCALESKEIRKQLGESASVDEFLQLLQSGEEHEMDIQLIAAQGLKVAAVAPANKQTIVDAGGHILLVDLLRRWDEEGQAVVAWTLNNVIIGSPARKMAVFKAGAVSLLIKVLRNGSLEGRIGAAATLQNLAVIVALRDNIIGAGAVPLLVDLLRDGPELGQIKACDALRNLALGSEARAAAIAKQEDCIPLLVRAWETGGKEAKKSASDALRELATNSPLRLHQIAVAGGARAL